MRRLLGLGWVVAVVASAGGVGCTGAQGAMGKPGEPGASASTDPNVSAVTPSYAYVGRTVDLSISGSETNWSDKTTVVFGEAHVKVNKVTAASPAALLVNVTVESDAAIATTDVTVVDGTNMEVYKGAFQVRGPLSVSLDQPHGVPQGGFATVTADMLDLTTPFDPNNLGMTFSVQDVSLWTLPAAGGDYSLNAIVAADVLAKAGESVDVDVTSGQGSQAVGSPAKGAFEVASRAPTSLQDGMQVTGMIATGTDSSLYQYVPGGASTRFVQFNASSPDMGGLLGIALPKSGKYADALAGFGVRFGLGTASADPLYIVVADGGNPFAPPPYGFDLSVTETPCTSFTVTGSHASTADAFALTTLPALAQKDYGDGSNMLGDWFGITAVGTTIHAATGGDGLSDVQIAVLASDGMTTLAASMDDASSNHKDIVATGATAGQTYYVQVLPGGSFDPTHSTYELFVESK